MMNWLCDGYAQSKEDNEFYIKYNELMEKPEIRDTSGVNNLMPFQMAANINWGETFLKAIENGDEHVPGKTRIIRMLLAQSWMKLRLGLGRKFI